MTTPIVIDCDPGHDDAIAILLALASPEVELRGITTVGGNQTLDKTTRNALKVLELADRTDIPVAAGADRPLVRELRTAANVHGESGLDGPDLPEPTTTPVTGHAADLLAVQAELCEIARIRLELVIAAGVRRGDQHVEPVLLHELANASPPSIPFGHAEAWKRALFSRCCHSCSPVQSPPAAAKHRDSICRFDD